MPARDNPAARAAPLVGGAALVIKLLNSWCTRCSEAGAHSDHFLLHINTKHTVRVEDTVVFRMANSSFM